jgi:signal transduction histidine kinase
MRQNGPNAGVGSDALAAMSDVVLSIAAELPVEPVLGKLVDAARALAGARYAAIGTTAAGSDGFDRFVTSGMTEADIEAIGPLPRWHGLLGLLLTDPVPYRTDDITADPRFAYFPSHHPQMRSFLGVPIFSKGDVIGAFYLTDKLTDKLTGTDGDTTGFDEGDQELIELLAAHAAIAIENARLHELSRELAVAEERNRLARELHDSMNQHLFGLILNAEAALAAVRDDPTRAEAQLKQVKDLARSTMEELRTLIAGLRPPALEADGLATTLRKQLDVLRRANRATIDLSVTGEGRLDLDDAQEVLRIAQEALRNALQHAHARTVNVELDQRGAALTLVVRDDGVGFDPLARSARSRRLGLTTMRERARALGGSLRITSAPGAGTTVKLVVPGRKDGRRG